MNTRQKSNQASPADHLHKLSRRQFLGATTIASAAFSVVPGGVLGLNGAASPNQKLNIAGIGIAGQGGQDLNQFKNENIVALCDVDWAHAAGTFKQFPNAKKYKDFRKMLEEQKDIDAVVVATPDHVHAFASMMAIKMGKHVYCEKPLTHSVWEARQVAAAAREHNVATQMGNQGQASEATRRLCEMIWDGAIGPVREAHIWTDRPSNGLFNEYWPQGVDRPKDTPPVPATLDWDLWLGPAPARPYHPAYLPFKWRGWWDFGTGALADIGCHSMDPVFRALGLGYPGRIEPESTKLFSESAPACSRITYYFPAKGSRPEVKVVWRDGSLFPTRPKEVADPLAWPFDTSGQMWVGDAGKLVAGIHGEDPRLLDPARQAELTAHPPAQKYARTGGVYAEWIAAGKGGPTAGSSYAVDAEPMVTKV